jgi:hypothetical protein
VACLNPFQRGAAEAMLDRVCLSALERDLTLPRLVQLRQHAGSHTTLPWSKVDSNSGSHPRATPPAATRFVADSALEGDGFELLVPRHKSRGFRLCRLGLIADPPAT